MRPCVPAMYQLWIFLFHPIADPRCAGMTVTIFDADLDPDGSLAAWLVTLLRDVFGTAKAGRQHGI